MNTIFLLLVIYQIKHYLADYPLQNEYMLGKFKESGWQLPLLAHAGVHAVFTFAIATFFTGFTVGLLLAVFDLVVHFTMDRIKASPKMLGKHVCLSKNEFIRGVTEEQKESNVKFWRALGIDQMVHHLTHYVIIAVIVGLK